MEQYIELTKNEVYEAWQTAQSFLDGLNASHYSSYSTEVAGGVVLALCKKVLVASHLAGTAAAASLVSAAKNLSVSLDRVNKTMYRDYYKSVYERMNNSGYTKVRITGNLSDRSIDGYYYTQISGTPRTYALFKNNQWIIAP